MNCDSTGKEMVQHLVRGEPMRTQICTESQCRVRERRDGFLDCYNCFKKLNVSIISNEEGTIEEGADMLPTEVRKSSNEVEENENSDSIKSSRKRKHIASKLFTT